MKYGGLPGSKGHPGKMLAATSRVRAHGVLRVNPTVHTATKSLSMVVDELPI